MSPDKLFVENPFMLASLFNKGIYVIPELENAASGFIQEGDKQIIIAIFEDNPTSVINAAEIVNKLMRAVKFNGKLLGSQDYSIINSNVIKAEDPLSFIINEYQPAKIMIFSDQWISPQKEIIYYSSQHLGNTEILRCHSPKTVIADQERKVECWSAVKSLFGM